MNTNRPIFTTAADLHVGDDIFGGTLVKWTRVSPTIDNGPEPDPYGEYAELLVVDTFGTLWPVVAGLGQRVQVTG